MEKDYDEIISDILIQLATLEQTNENADIKTESNSKRIDLTIKRMVKVEQRLETIEKQLQLLNETQNDFIASQKKRNQEFLELIIKNSSK